MKKPLCSLAVFLGRKESTGAGAPGRGSTTLGRSFSAASGPFADRLLVSCLVLSPKAPDDFLTVSWVWGPSSGS